MLTYWLEHKFGKYGRGINGQRCWSYHELAISVFEPIVISQNGGFLSHEGTPKSSIYIGWFSVISFIQLMMGTPFMGTSGGWNLKKLGNIEEFRHAKWWFGVCESMGHCPLRANRKWNVTRFAGLPSWELGCYQWYFKRFYLCTGLFGNGFHVLEQGNIVLWEL